MESPRSLREKVEGMGVGQEGMATSTEQEGTTPRPTVVEGDAKRGKGSWRVGGGGHGREEWRWLSKLTVFSVQGRLLD